MSKSWITIYTDGAAKGNPGPAGYGAVLRFNQHKKEIYGHLGVQTSNQAELYAVIRALETVTAKGRGRFISIYSDSKYVVEGANGRWRIVTNQTLWRRLKGLVEKHEEVVFNWIPRQDNEEADKLANKGARR